jgi:hypothetical protein
MIWKLLITIPLITGLGVILMRFFGESWSQSVRFAVVVVALLYLFDVVKWVLKRK